LTGRLARLQGTGARFSKTANNFLVVAGPAAICRGAGDGFAGQLPTGTGAEVNFAGENGLRLSLIVRKQS
jgi:hypothetical protein